MNKKQKFSNYRWTLLTNITELVGKTVKHVESLDFTSDELNAEPELMGSYYDLYVTDGTMMITENGAALNRKLVFASPTLLNAIYRATEVTKEEFYSYEAE